MEGATHFIEQWSIKARNTTHNTGKIPINRLKTFLKETKECGNLYTVCIFKIKIKKP